MDNPRITTASSTTSGQTSDAVVTYLTSIFDPVLTQHPEKWRLQNQLALNMAIMNAPRRGGTGVLSRKYLQRLRSRGRLTLLKNVHLYGERGEDHDLLKREIRGLMDINSDRATALMERVFLTQRNSVRDTSAAQLLIESVNHFIPYAWANLEDGSERWGPIPHFIVLRHELASHGVTNALVVGLWLNIQMANLWAGSWLMYDHMILAKMHNKGRYKFGDAMISFTPIMKNMIEEMLKISMVRMKKSIEKRARTADRGGGSDSDSDDAYINPMN